MDKARRNKDFTFCTAMGIMFGKFTLEDLSGHFGKWSNNDHSMTGSFYVALSAYV